MIDSTTGVVQYLKMASTFHFLWSFWNKDNFLFERSGSGWWKNNQTANALGFYCDSWQRAKPQANYQLIETLHLNSIMHCGQKESLRVINILICLQVFDRPLGFGKTIYCNWFLSTWLWKFASFEPTTCISW